METIILKLKRLQEAKNLSIPQLAEKVGMSKQNIYDIYSHKTALSLKHLEIFSIFFKVPMTFWFSDDSSIVNDPEVAYRLKQRVEELEDDKDHLKQTIEFLQEKFGHDQHSGKKNCG